MALHALIVDDDAEVRILTGEALRNEGFECEFAVDGIDGIDQFDHCAFDLVIADLRMPRQHGHAMVMNLLNRPTPPTVMVLTGVAEPRLVKDLLARGVKDVMFKPIRYELLAAKARAFLGAKTHRDASVNSATHAAQLGEVLTFGALLDDYEKLPFVHKKQAQAMAKIDWMSQPDPPASLWAFAEQLDAPAEGDATTTSLRQICAVMAQPIDTLARPIGIPFKVLTLDLSANRIDLVHTREIDCAKLLLQFRAESGNVNVAVNGLACEPDLPFFRISTAISTT